MTTPNRAELREIMRNVVQTNHYVPETPLPRDEHGHAHVEDDPDSAPDERI